MLFRFQSSIHAKEADVVLQKSSHHVFVSVQDLKDRTKTLFLVKQHAHHETLWGRGKRPSHLRGNEVSARSDACEIYNTARCRAEAVAARASLRSTHNPRRNVDL